VEAALLSSFLYRAGDLFRRLLVHWMWWPAIGGVVVGLGGLIDAHVLGAGYSNTRPCSTARLLHVVLVLQIVKATARLVALGSGTSGGVLAPLLILGGALGALIGQFLPRPVGL
jgi:CIC family chloride channel protein